MSIEKKKERKNKKREISIERKKDRTIEKEQERGIIMAIMWSQ